MFCLDIQLKTMNLCRICLCSKPRKDISELKVTEHDKKVIYIEIMMFCLGIQVKEDSNISTKLCVECFRKIIDFYNFKTLAQNNEAHLRSVTTQHDETEAITDLKNNDVIPGLEEENILIPDVIKEEQICDDVKIKDLITEHDQLVGTDDQVHDVNDEYNYESESDNDCLSNVKIIKCKSETVDNTIEKDLVKNTKKSISRPKETKCKKFQALGKQICDQCGKAVQDLKAHAVQHMSPELVPKYKCDLCANVFRYKNSMRKHIQRRHMNLKKKCPICSKDVIHLNLHMNRVHCPEKKVYECLSCNRRYISQSALKQHMKSHSIDLQYKHECKICSKKFKTKATAAEHKRFFHDKERRHVCEYCSKSFYTNCKLQEHIRTHTKEKPFKCKKCDKNFATTNMRNNHMLIHSSVKKFACTFCDKAFVRNDYLHAHIKSHTKEKKFPCRFCDAKFHRQHHRSRHEYTAHLKLMTGDKKCSNIRQ